MQEHTLSFVLLDLHLRLLEFNMSDNTSITIVIGLIVLSGMFMMSASEYADTKKAQAGLQQCYVPEHNNPIWMKECPK